MKTLEDEIRAYRPGQGNLNRGGVSKKPGQVSAATRLARDYFLRGNGDGRPITNALKLKELTGVAICTIEKWRPLWERERMEIAVRESPGKGKLAALITEETVAWQSGRVAKLKQQCEDIEAHLATLPLGTDSYAETQRLYIQTLKKWEESSGYADHADTLATAAKELVKQAARLQGRDSQNPDKEKKVSGYTFDVDSTTHASKE